MQQFFMFRQFLLSLEALFIQLSITLSFSLFDACYPICFAPSLFLPLLQTDFSRSSSSILSYCGTGLRLSPVVAVIVIAQESLAPIS